MIPHFTLCHPCAVCPFQIGNIRYSGGCSWSEFRIIRKRICFKNAFPLLCLNAELVQISLFHARYKTGIDADRFLTLHIIRLKIPAVKIAYNRNSAGIRCPNSEVYALLAFVSNLMCAHLFINLIMVALTEEILIQLSDLKRLQFFLCAFSLFHKSHLIAHFL